MNFLQKLPDAINSSPKNNFTIINNSVFRNPNISFKAKGILGLLLSNSDNWKSYESAIQDVGPDGRDSIRSALKELEEFDFLWRIIYVNKITKQAAGSFWAYTDTPKEFNIEKPLEWLDNNGYEVWSGSKKYNLTEPKTGKPSTANRPLRISNNKNKKKTYVLPAQNFIHLFPTPYQQNSLFVHTWDSFVAERKQSKHPITERAVELIVTKIRNECREDIDWAVACIKKSIEFSYRGIFFNRPQQATRNAPIRTSQQPQEKIYKDNPNNRICNPNGGY